MTKMTGAAASRFGMKKRGLLDEGYAADVVVFDWARVSDRVSDTGDATPSGIEQVFINGRQMLANGEIRTNRGAGEVLLA
jgi:N-acyl-D-amino-acid deacylase